MNQDFKSTLYCRFHHNRHHRSWRSYFWIERGARTSLRCYSYSVQVFTHSLKKQVRKTFSPGRFERNQKVSTDSFGLYTGPSSEAFTLLLLGGTNDGRYMMHSEPTHPRPYSLTKHAGRRQPSKYEGKTSPK